MPHPGSFLKGLFFGHIEEELLFPYPRRSASDTQHVDRLIDQLRKLKEQRIDSQAIDRDGELPTPLLGDLRELGLFGLSIPTRFGGLGLGCSAWCRLLEEMARLDGSLAMTVGSHISLGCQGLLLYGTPAQQRRWLPRLASGEVIAAFGLSEAHTGSDAAALRTVARQDRAGGPYTVDGHKVYVTNGGIAGLYTVFARLQGGSRTGLAALLLERGPQVQAAPRRLTLGIRGANTTDLHIAGAPVDADGLLGEPGAGFRLAMEVLNRSRVAVSAGCLGLSEAALRLALDHARGRQAFGRPLTDFGMIQKKIGNMAANCFAIESVVYLSTGLIDAARSDTSLECAATKVFASEVALQTVNHCVEISGGLGYLRGSSFDRLLRDTRVNLVLSGTNEVLRMHIALAGLSGPLEFLRSVASAIRRPLRSAGLLADYALERFNRRLRRDRLSLARPELGQLAVDLTERVARFAALIERLVREHGEELLHEQFLQERLANIIVTLYAAFAVIARTSMLLEQGDQERSRLAVVCSRVLLARFGRTLDEETRGCATNEDRLLRDLARDATHRGRSF